MEDQLYSICQNSFSRSHGKNGMDTSSARALSFLNQVKKPQLLGDITTMYGKYFICVKYYHLKYFMETIARLEGMKPKAEEYHTSILELLRWLKRYEGLLSREHNDIIYATTVPYYVLERIITSSGYIAYADLLPWKEVVSSKTYSVLHFLYDVLMGGGNAGSLSYREYAFAVMLAMMRWKPHELFDNMYVCEFTDVLWKIIFSVISRGGIPEELHKYCIVARELYYYKLKKKTRTGRIGYILAAFRAVAEYSTKINGGKMIMDKIDHPLASIDDKEKPTQKRQPKEKGAKGQPCEQHEKDTENDPFEYLHYLCEIDEVAIKEVRDEVQLVAQEREQWYERGGKYLQRVLKPVTVDGLPATFSSGGEPVTTVVKEPRP
jgi:hypothetical protein